MAKWSGAVGAAALFFFFCPPFRIVPLDAAREREKRTEFDPRAYAESFWNGPLARSFDRAVPAEVLLAAIGKDPKEARRRFGRSVGLGNVYYYYVRGKGRIVKADEDAVLLDIEGKGEVSLVADAVFGNAVRNAAGLIDVNDFSNSQDFNNISLCLNEIVEKRIIPVLRKEAAAGRRVEFVGCCEIMNEATDLNPLVVVPVRVEFE